MPGLIKLENAVVVERTTAGSGGKKPRVRDKVVEMVETDDEEMNEEDIVKQGGGASGAGDGTSAKRCIRCKHER